MKIVELERMNSRDNYNLGTMIFFHNKYDLGDSHDIITSDYSSFSDMQKSLMNKYKVVVPVYLYDHSNLSFSTSPFSCPWDSGQIGFMVVSAEKIRENFQICRATKKKVEYTIEIIKEELDEYALYVNSFPKYYVEDDRGILDYFNSKEEAEEYVRNLNV